MKPPKLSRPTAEDCALSTAGAPSSDPAHALEECPEGIDAALAAAQGANLLVYGVSENRATLFGDPFQGIPFWGVKGGDPILEDTHICWKCYPSSPFSGRP